MRVCWLSCLFVSHFRCSVLVLVVVGHVPIVFCVVRSVIYSNKQYYTTRTKDSKDEQIENNNKNNNNSNDSSTTPTKGTARHETTRATATTTNRNQRNSCINGGVAVVFGVGGARTTTNRMASQGGRRRIANNTNNNNNNNMNTLKTISKRRATPLKAATTLASTAGKARRLWSSRTRTRSITTPTPTTTATRTPTPTTRTTTRTTTSPTTPPPYDKRKLSSRTNIKMAAMLPTLLLAAIILGTDLAGSDMDFLQQLTNIPVTVAPSPLTPPPTSSPSLRLPLLPKSPAVDLFTMEPARAIPTMPPKTTPTIIIATNEETAATTKRNLSVTAGPHAGAEAEAGAGAGDGAIDAAFSWTDLPSPTTFENDETATITIIHSPSLPTMDSDGDKIDDDAAGSGDGVAVAAEGVLVKPPSDSLTRGFSIPTFLPPFPSFAVADLPAYAAGTSTTTTTTTTTLVPILTPDIYQQQDQLYMAVLSHQQVRRNLTMPSINVTVQMGNHAYLPCNIRRFMNKPVSWVRVRDGHILSVDQTTFIADQRFQTIFKGENEYTWSLQIKYIQHTDEGWYECQVSTEPKMSAKVYLSVVVPITELIGDQNRFVKAGSKVALHCIVRGTLDPPTYIIWFRGKMQITDENKMGWYTQIDRTIFGNASDNQNTIGSLIIPFVRKKDSGNFTCQPSNSQSVSVDLHVLSGEYSASAIMSGASGFRMNANYLFLLLLWMALQKT